jgi:hypothetical protein
MDGVIFIIIIIVIIIIIIDGCCSYSGSILAALDTFRNIWISKKDYEENGVRGIDQKTF